jgi:ribosomal protein L7/L12
LAPAHPESGTGSGEPVPQPNDLEGQILSLIEQNRKIAAIKLYREQTGSGLKEAKDAVEGLALGQKIAKGSPEGDGIKSDNLESQVLALMQSQKKIQAIKLYRTQSGVGLKEAKDAVEALAARYGISPKGAGCAGMVLLMAVISTIIGIGAWIKPL